MKIQDTQGFNLSLHQKRVWSNLQKGAELYTKSIVKLSCDLQPEKALAILEKIANKHDVFSIGFEEIPHLKYPVQNKRNTYNEACVFQDITTCDTALREETISEILNGNSSEPLYLKLVKIKEDEYWLVVMLPALLSDSYTNLKIVRDFIGWYFSDKRVADPIQYLQFSEWQNGLLENPDPEAALFWDKQCASLNENLSFFNEGIKSVASTNSHHRVVSLEIEDSITEQIQQQSLTGEMEMSLVLYGCYYIHLYKHFPQKSTLTYYVPFKREFEELEGIIGHVSKALPVLLEVEEDESCSDILEKIKQSVEHVLSSQEYFSYDQIPDNETGENPLSFGFEYVDIDYLLADSHSSDLQIDVLNLYTNCEPFKLKLLCIKKDGKLKIDFYYDTRFYDEEAIQIIKNQFSTLLSHILTSPSCQVSDLSFLSSYEKEAISSDFDNALKAEKPDKTILDLFNEQVYTNPNSTALIDDSSAYSYQQVEELSSQLANLLSKEYLIGKEDVVAILAKRSSYSVIAILATLKTGAAFLPIDVDYPDKRIHYILEDAEIKLLITDNDDVNYPGSFKKLALSEDWGKVSGYQNQYAGSKPEACDLAYAIYTSGSTGKPKGCLIEHGNLFNYISWANGYYLEESIPGNFGLFTSLSFDFTLTSIFMPLTSGGTLKIFPHDEGLDTILHSIFSSQSGIDIIKLTPAHVHIIEGLEIPKSDLKVAILGGEALALKQVSVLQNINQGMQIYNEYGPTETTIGCTVWKADPESTVVLIGRPILNTHIFILDELNELLPVGVAGEICIAGHGVARGYKNLPAVTKEKFIPNPFVPDGRLYKTGDYGKILPNGEIVYIGRKDNQVKIRGFRVELEEVERNLLELDIIKECVVKVFEDQDKYLVAYIVVNERGNHHDIKSMVAEYLPESMVPQYIVNLDKIPLTTNGKIDRDLLPDPRLSFSNKKHEPSTNEKEELLVDIWQEILGKQKIGITDTFFDLGGDSIKAILIVSRVYKKGHSLEVKEVFNYPTIKELALHLKSKKKKSDQSIVIGNAALLPIQRDFFQFDSVDKHHYNHAVTLDFPNGLSKSDCEDIFSALITHHDALRMVYSKEGAELKQYNKGLENSFDIKYEDISAGDTSFEELGNEIENLQRSIDLENGPLVKLALVHAQDKDSLLIIIHHLVIDGISWRIIFDDINLLYQKLVEGKNTELPEKTDAFSLWANNVTSHAASEEFSKEAAYWAEINRNEIKNWNRDYTVEGNLVKDTAKQQFTLDEKATEKLLAKASYAFNTKINDLLLTALAISLGEIFEKQQIPLMLEGHGREPIVGNIDLNRTVGWFTSEFPVLFSHNNENALSYKIKSVKEYMRKIPHNGVGFGLWKHFVKEEKEEVLLPQVSFNYLGQFDTDIKDKSFKISNGFTGDIASPESSRKYDFEFVGMVVDEKLTFSLTYNSKQYKSATIEKLQQKFKETLLTIIDYCLAQDEQSLSPGDLTYPDLTIEQVEYLEKYNHIQDIYKLSPLQDGLFYQWLLDKSSKAYFNQLSFNIEGNFEVDIFTKAVNHIIARHDMLRSIFTMDHADFPLQIVLKAHQVDIDYVDITGLNTEEEREKVANIKSEAKARGFNLSQEVPIRIIVFKKASDRYEIVWNIHHIIIDAWCSNILFREFSIIYECLLSAKEIKLPQATQFKTYLNWLSLQDEEEAIRYWKHYLNGYQEKVMLPSEKSSDTSDFIKGELSFSIDRKLTAELHDFSKENQVTLSSVLNAYWGVLLHKYCKERDVVFGAITSGRPPEIEGVEGMIGLTINMVPVRVEWNEEQSFRELTQQVQKFALKSLKYSHVSLAEIQAKSNLDADLISHYVDFHNISSDVYAPGGETSSGTLNFESMEGEEQSNYDFQVLILSRKELNIVLRYNKLAFSTPFVEEVKNDLITGLRAVAGHPDIQVVELLEKVLDPLEKLDVTEFSKGLVNKEEEDF